MKIIGKTRESLSKIKEDLEKKIEFRKKIVGKQSSQILVRSIRKETSVDEMI